MEEMVQLPTVIFTVVYLIIVAAGLLLPEPGQPPLICVKLLDNFIVDDKTTSSAPIKSFAGTYVYTGTPSPLFILVSLML